MVEILFRILIVTFCSFKSVGCAPQIGHDLLALAQRTLSAPLGVRGGVRSRQKRFSLLSTDGLYSQSVYIVLNPTIGAYVQYVHPRVHSNNIHEEVHRLLGPLARLEGPGDLQHHRHPPHCERTGNSLKKLKRVAGVYGCDLSHGMLRVRTQGASSFPPRPVSQWFWPDLYQTQYDRMKRKALLGSNGFSREPS